MRLSAANGDMLAGQAMWLVEYVESTLYELGYGYAGKNVVVLGFDHLVLVFGQ